VEVRVDVAIIGAGPAGSTLGALLASRGVSVALIDRGTFPRDKVCGEFLSYDALPVLERLGVSDEIDRRGSPHIRRCRIVGRNRTYEFPMPEPSRGVSRLLLDDLLFRTATVRGAQPWDGWTAETIDWQSITLSRNSGTSPPESRGPHADRETYVITAGAIVGAWGRWGRFDTQLRRAFVRDRSHRSFGFKRHYRREASGQQETIELHSFERGYLGINDIEGGLTNICGLVHSSRLAGHRGRWESFVDTLRAEESSLDAMYSAYVPAQEDFLSSEPVIFRARRAVERGVFMIGDASGVVDPLSGNGMAMAIQSALIAAPRLLRLVSNPERREEIEREYIRAHVAMFRPRIAWSRRIATLLSRPSLLDNALRLARGKAVGAFLVRRTRAERDRVAQLLDLFFKA
jgi:menaquinone-9 beta-reductase